MVKREVIDICSPSPPRPTAPLPSSPIAPAPPATVTNAPQSLVTTTQASISSQEEEHAAAYQAMIAKKLFVRIEGGVEFPMTFNVSHCDEATRMYLEAKITEYGGVIVSAEAATYVLLPLGKEEPAVSTADLMVLDCAATKPFQRVVSHRWVADHLDRVKIRRGRLPLAEYFVERAEAPATLEYTPTPDTTMGDGTAATPPTTAAISSTRASEIGLSVISTLETAPLPERHSSSVWQEHESRRTSTRDFSKVRSSYSQIGFKKPASRDVPRSHTPRAKQTVTPVDPAVQSIQLHPDPKVDGRLKRKIDQKDWETFALLIKWLEEQPDQGGIRDYLRACERKRAHVHHKPKGGRSPVTVYQIHLGLIRKVFPQFTRPPFYWLYGSGQTAPQQIPFGTEDTEDNATNAIKDRLSSILTEDSDSDSQPEAVEHKPSLSEL